MIERKPIEISDKALFENKIDKFYNSMYNFTTLFMWSKESAFSYSIIDGMLVTFMEFDKMPPCAYLPIGDGDFKSAVIKTCEYLKSLECTPVFRNLNDEMVKKLDDAFLGEFEFVENPDRDEYIYETKSLITLSGKKLHAKKNHLNAFIKSNDFSYIRLTENDMQECRELFDKWMNNKNEMVWVKESEHATFRLLDNFKNLNVLGGGIKTGGRLAAYSIGERVSDDTALIHIEVADPTVRGAFNIINQQFAEREWSDTSFIDREEDMGLEGLRKAKEAYRPHHMLKVYCAVKKK